jgi:hypothetical protein
VAGRSATLARPVVGDAARDDDGGPTAGARGRRPAAELPLATVPWPFVERRRTSRTGPGRGPLDLPPALEVPVQRTHPGARAHSAPPARRRATSARSWSRWIVGVAVATDAAAATAAALGAYLVRFGAGLGSAAYLLGVLVAPVVWVAAVALARGYERRWFGSGSEEFRCILRAGLLVVIGAATLSYALHAELARGFLLAAASLVLLASLGGRLACRAVLNAARRRGGPCSTWCWSATRTRCWTWCDQVVRSARSACTSSGACVPGGRAPRLEALGRAGARDLHDAPAVVRRRPSTRWP